MSKSLMRAVIVVLVISLALGQFAYAAREVVLKINDTVITNLQVKPFVDEESGQVLIPVRVISEFMGAKVIWKAQENKVIVQKGKTNIEMKIGDSRVVVNGQTKKLGAKVVARNKATYVPMQFVSECLGAKVSWDKKSYTVTIRFEVAEQQSTAGEFKVKVPVISGQVVKMQVDEEGKPVVDREMVVGELRRYGDNQETTWPHDRHYLDNANYLKKFGESETMQMLQIAKSLIEIQYNVDYRNLPKDYKKEYLYYHMPGRTDIESTVDGWIKDIEKYTIVCNAQFISDKSLVYLSKDGEDRVRGRLYFSFKKPTQNQYYKERLKLSFETEQWYYIDMEICLGNYFSQNPTKWTHTQYTYGKTVFLSDYVKVGDR